MKQTTQMNKYTRKYDAIQAESVKWVAAHKDIRTSEQWVRRVLKDRNIMGEKADQIRKLYFWKYNKLQEAAAEQPKDDEI